MIQAQADNAGPSMLEIGHATTSSGFREKHPEPPEKVPTSIDLITTEA